MQQLLLMNTTNLTSASAPLASKLTITAVTVAVRAAVQASLAAKGKRVPVLHTAFAGYVVSARQGRMYRVQQYPSTFIRLTHVASNVTIWSVQSGELHGAVKLLVRNGSLESSLRLWTPAPAAPTAETATDALDYEDALAASGLA